MSAYCENSQHTQCGAKTIAVGLSCHRRLHGAERALEVYPAGPSVSKVWLWGNLSAHRLALPKRVDPAFKILFEDEVSGAVQPRLVIPNILADLPRIVRFLEICASQTGLGRSDSPLA